MIIQRTYRKRLLAFTIIFSIAALIFILAADLSLNNLLSIFLGGMSAGLILFTLYDYGTSKACARTQNTFNP